MSIRFSCPTCSKQLQAPDALAGKRVKCKGCATLIDLPAAPEAEAVYDAQLVEEAPTVLDAVLVEGNGGATTSYAYYVYVVPKGEPVSQKLATVASLYDAGRSEHAYGVDLKWEETDRLAVQYLSAKYSTNISHEVTIAGEQVSIILRSNINNAAAPRGGMVFNLKKDRR